MTDPSRPSAPLDVEGAEFAALAAPRSTPNGKRKRSTITSKEQLADAMEKLDALHIRTVAARAGVDPDSLPHLPPDPQLTPAQKQSLLDDLDLGPAQIDALVTRAPAAMPIELRLDQDTLTDLDWLCSVSGMSRGSLITHLVAGAVTLNTTLSKLLPQEEGVDVTALAAHTLQHLVEEPDQSDEPKEPDTQEVRLRRRAYRQCMGAALAGLFSYRTHLAVQSPIARTIDEEHYMKLVAIATRRNVTVTYVLRDFIESLASTWLVEKTGSRSWGKWSRKQSYPPTPERAFINPVDLKPCENPALLTPKHFKALNALKEHPRAGEDKSTRTLMHTLIDMRFAKDYPEGTFLSNGRFLSTPEPDTLE
jgi:hypothetical protein